MKYPNNRTAWIQGGLTALIVLILLFFILAPSSRAQADSFDLSRAGADSHVPGTIDSRHLADPYVTTDRRFPC